MKKIYLQPEIQVATIDYNQQLANSTSPTMNIYNKKNGDTGDDTVEDFEDLL